MFLHVIGENKLKNKGIFLYWFAVAVILGVICFNKKSRQKKSDVNVIFKFVV